MVDAGTVDAKSLTADGGVGAKLGAVEVGAMTGPGEIVMAVGLSSERWLWLLLGPLAPGLKMRFGPGADPNPTPSPTAGGPLPVKNGGLAVLATFVIVCWPPPAAAALIRRDRS